jgi:iron complex outermembrane receptor protein
LRRLDPANFISRVLYQELTVVSGKDWQARADVSYDLDLGFLKRLQVGVRYGDRKAARDRGSSYINNESANILLTSLPGADVRATLPGFTYNNVQPNFAYAALTRDSIRDNLVQLRSFFGMPEGVPAFDPFENFRVSEQSYAAYGQLKYGFDLGGTIIDGVLGLRAIKTKTQIAGFGSIGGVTGPIEAQNDYTDYLPNASARIALSEKLQLRLAYTQTRTRPNFFDLRPTLTLGQPVILPPGDTCLIAANANTEVCLERLRRGGSGGNPYLRPLTSNNYDVSLEYYFSRTGSVTAALFRHDANGFLATVDNRYTDPTYGPVRINQPINLGDTRVQGAEVSFTSFLDIDALPDWAKGFGLQANATYLDAKGDLPPDQAATFNNEQQTFRGVSKWAYNLVALYERPQFSTRLAYNYRSKFILIDPGYTFQALDPIAHPVIEKGRGQLDFSTSVTPVPNITVAFDIINLLGNPLQRYRQYDTGDSFARQVVYIERAYSLGVRFRF